MRNLADSLRGASVLAPGPGQALALHLSWEGLPDAADASELPVVGCQAHLALRDEAYTRSTTLVRNDDGLVPLHLAPSERLLVVSPSQVPVSQAVEIPFSPAPRFQPDIRVHVAAAAPHALDSVGTLRYIS